MAKRLSFLIAFFLLCLSTVWAQKPEMSFPGHQVWYQVVSAFPETQGMVMSDVLSASASFPIGVEAPQEALASQQWLLVYADEEKGLLYLVNRNSGRIIQPVSEVAEPGRVVQLGNSAREGMGFVLTGLGRGEYAFVGTEADGQLRGLVAAQQGQDMEDIALEQASPFAWTLRKMEITTGVDGTSEGEKPLIHVKDGHIVVTGGVTYSVVRADGVEMPRGSRLSPGVYMVTVEGRTTKVVYGK